MPDGPLSGTTTASRISYCASQRRASGTRVCRGMRSGLPSSMTWRSTHASSGVDGSSDRDSRPAASSRTRATSSPSGPMNAAVARSDRRSSLASPRTLFMTSSSSTELLTAWLNR